MFCLLRYGLIALFAIGTRSSMIDEYDIKDLDDGYNYKKLLSLQFIHDIDFEDKTTEINGLHDKKRLLSELNEDELSVECHKVALHRCGSIFIKVFRLLDFLSEEEAYQPKCTLRTAFFNCLQKDKEKLCHKHEVTVVIDEKFRNKMSDLLWSTRVCVLGIKTRP